MLDIAYIRENPDKVKQGITNKNFNPDIVDKVLTSDAKRRDLIGQIEVIRAERNKLNDELKSERTPELMTKSGQLKEKLQTLEPQLREAEEEYASLMLQIPGVPLDEVTVGKDSTGNEI